MYLFDQKPATVFSPESASVLSGIRNSEYSVLVGRNNCGKSFILKQLATEWGANASYLGPARYQNFNILGMYAPNRNKKHERFTQFLQLSQNTHHNIDNSPLSLQQAIAELSDDQRATLAEIIKRLLNVDLEWRQTVEGNSMSQKYVSCNGHNISYTSSGFRLITTLVTSLLDTDFDTFLIDEPELGISPEAQGILADFLFDRAHRAKYFPHIRTIVFATHSTIFLDRATISNNYTVEKQGDQISIRQIKTQSDFNDVHFFLLGNRFETLYLPSAIVLLEGKCDAAFIERVLSLKFPGSQISVIAGNSDSRVKEILHVAKDILKDFQRSPYRDRIFVVLDSVHTAGLSAGLQAMGIAQDNITIWPRNGIEYYYPPTVIDMIFGAGGDLEIVGDVVSRNGISHNKGELVRKVVELLREDTPMHPEFESRFLRPLSARLG